MGEVKQVTQGFGGNYYMDEKKEVRPFALRGERSQRAIHIQFRDGRAISHRELYSSIQKSLTCSV